MVRELADILQEILGYDYRLERELPGGGMSRLFLATERSLDRRVVVKVLPPELVSDAMLARFKREVEVTAGLLHPHVLPVLSAGARDDVLYYVMPYVEGESLRHRLNREGRLPMEDALVLLSEVADALAYAHGKGVVHRDIKPENILLQGGHALLADFGIARALHDEDAGRQVITTPGLPIGTFGYAPPEQVRGDRPADARADVYALAVVGYEMLTGEMPPAHPDAHDPPRRRPLVPALGRRSGMRVTVARHETPLTVSRAIMRALSAAPEDRFQTAAEFRDALREPYSRQVARRRRAWRAAAVAATAVVAAVGAAYALYDPEIADGRVVVAPFDAADPSLQPWREGVADMLARNFDGAGPLRSVPPRAVFRRATGGDDSSAVELGHALGARYVIAGALRRIGADSVQIQAALFERNKLGGVTTLDRVEYADVESRIAPLADRVTVRFLDALLQRGVRLRAGGRPRLLGAGSILALKEYLRGEQLFRRNQYDSALAAYRAAVETDSTFALAHWRVRSAMRATAGEFDESSIASALTAGRLNRGLGQRDSLLVLADSLYAMAPSTVVEVATAPFQRRRLAVLETAARLYPDDPEVQTELGEARLHFGSRFGRTWEQALESFERAVGADSAYAPAYYHLIQLRGTLLDLGSAAVAAEAAARHAPDDWRPPVLAAAARTGRFDTSVVRTRALTYEQWSLFSNIGWRWTGPLDPSITSTEAGFPLDSVRTRRGLVRRYALHGKLATLRRRARPEDWERSPHVLVFAGLAGTYPAAYVDSVAGGWLRGGTGAHLHAGVTWWRARRDTAALRAAVARGESLAARGGDAERYARASASAALALARGDSSLALARLLALPDQICPPVWCMGEQILRARLLVARGERARADSLLAARPPVWDAMRAEEPLWFLERARLAEASGRAGEAGRLYAWVARFWERADAPLADTARAAAAAAARLRGRR